MGNTAVKTPYLSTDLSGSEFETVDEQVVNRVVDLTKIGRLTWDRAVVGYFEAKLEGLYYFSFSDLLVITEVKSPFMAGASEGTLLSKVNPKTLQVEGAGAASLNNFIRRKKAQTRSENRKMNFLGETRAFLN